METSSDSDNANMEMCQEIDRVLSNVRRQLSKDSQNKRNCNNGFISDEGNASTSTGYSHTHSDIAREWVNACLEERQCGNPDNVAMAGPSRTSFRVNEMIKEAETSKLLVHRLQGKSKPF